MQSAFKPFNAHLKVDYSAYTVVICKQFKIEAFTSFWWNFHSQILKVMKQEFTVVMKTNNSNHFYNQAVGHSINYNGVRFAKVMATEEFQTVI